MTDTFFFKQYALGPMGNFIYAIADPKTKAACIIDPAWDVTTIETDLAQNGYELNALLLTHGHHDHTNAIPELLTRHKIPLFISKYESIYSPPNHAQVILTDDNDIIPLGALSMTCIHTPGHSPGGQCFLINDRLITGDTLFINGCGRCDLMGSDPEAMYHSLYSKLMTLDDQLRIYPGHNYGDKTNDTLKEQKKTNPYLTCNDKLTFLRKIHPI